MGQVLEPALFEISLALCLIAAPDPNIASEFFVRLGLVGAAHFTAFSF